MCSLRNRSKLTRIALGVLMTGSSLLLWAQRGSVFTPHEKAYYADPAQVAFVRPGLRISVAWANIASDGTISVDYKLTDPDGAPLIDPESLRRAPSPLLSRGVHSGRPGTVHLLHWRTVTAVSAGATATQATADSG